MFEIIVLKFHKASKLWQESRVAGESQIQFSCAWGLLHGKWNWIPGYILRNDLLPDLLEDERIFKFPLAQNVMNIHSSRPVSFFMLKGGFSELVVLHKAVCRHLRPVYAFTHKVRPIVFWAIKACVPELSFAMAWERHRIQLKISHGTQLCPVWEQWGAAAWQSVAEGESRVSKILSVCVIFVCTICRILIEAYHKLRYHIDVVSARNEMTNLWVFLMELCVCCNRRLKEQTYDARRGSKMEHSWLLD